MRTLDIILGLQKHIGLLQSRLDQFYAKPDRARYSIVRERSEDKAWSVTWDGRRVFYSTGEDAEAQAYTFATALEQGIVGSYDSLGANSKVEIKGVFEYLEAFDSYDDFGGE